MNSSFMMAMMLGRSDHWLRRRSYLYANKTIPILLVTQPDTELVITKSSTELDELLASLSTPYEKRVDAVNMQLQAMGFPITTNTTTLEDREFVLQLTQVEGVPSPADRTRFFEIAKASTNLNWCSRFFEDWWKKLHNGVTSEPVAIMHLGFVFRHTGRQKDAITVTNVVEFGRDRFQCPSNLMSMIATTRAATFLDIFEKHSDPELLRLAKATAGKAWANKKTDETSLVYQRLDKLKREMEEINYKTKVSRAYADWADWRI